MQLGEPVDKGFGKHSGEALILDLMPPQITFRLRRLHEANYDVSDFQSAFDEISIVANLYR
ncbi:MAG: hypothetical protein KF853_13120 [Rhodocyclaceae bacterium]|nr:hypothetical protein [Rhodocyclaceae bacterium]MBX3677954.1 hypothetical protein [Rhodocyclaceae bacterium]